MQEISKNLFEMPLPQRMALMRQAEAELQRNPKNVEAMLAVAGIAGIEDSLDKATYWLKKAFALRKKDPEILRKLVSATYSARDFTAARKYARKLCELDPRNPDSHDIQGIVLEQMGQPRQAATSFARAAKLDPKKAGLVLAQARCHQMLGEHEAALNLFHEALKINPHSAEALYGIGAARKFEREEAERHADMAENAAARTEDDLEKVQLYFSAGKVLNDGGDYDRAFSFYLKANALTEHEDRDELWPQFRNLRDGFTREFLKLRADWGLDTAAPVFIIGMPRSGTTLTESICGAHPDVTAGDELPLLPAISSALGRSSPMPGKFSRNLEEIPRKGVQDMANDYLRRSKVVAGDTAHFTDKMPHNFLNVGLIALLFPNARIIHVRRHPLDNCVSLFSNSMTKMHNTYKSDLKTLGLYYRQYDQLMQHWREILPGKMHEVYYEDLVTNTELNARAIIEYLGLDWTDAVMDRSGSQRSVRTLSNWQVRQPVYDSSSGRWRSFENQLAPLMETLGPVASNYEESLAALAGGTREQREQA